MKKLLFCVDLDGTLLNSQSVVSCENKKALQAFVQAGHVFAIATGRNVHSAKMIYKTLDLQAPYLITCNGSRIYDVKQDMVIKKIHFPKGAVDAIIKYCLANNIHFQLANDTRQLTNFPPASYRENFFKTYFGLVHVPFNWEQVYDEDYILYVPVDFSDGKNAQILEDITSMIPKGFHHFLTQSHKGELLLEIVTGDIDKWNAACEVAKLLNINKPNIVTAGDSGNDLKMLANAHNSFAPGNATHAAKMAAKHDISNTNDENFVDAVINKYLLKKHA